MAWVHPGMSSQRLEFLRFWALRAAEQSREYGEAETEWSPYLDIADRAGALLDQRTDCDHRMSRYAGCSALRLRASEAEREIRGGCFFPLCLLSGQKSPRGRLIFNLNRQEM
jgi:hypothetical protein